MYCEVNKISAILDCSLTKKDRKVGTVWKNKKFSLTKKKIRQIVSLVIYVVNALLPRNLCQKGVRVNFRNFHTVRGE